MTRLCALCGQEVDESQFSVSEHWTKDEVASNNVGTQAMERADADDDGGYTFYFCRWRHLGDFLSDCEMESAQRSDIDPLSERSLP